MKNTILIALGILISLSIVILPATGWSPHDDFLFLRAFNQGYWRGVDSSEFISGRFDILHGLDLFILAKIFGENSIHIFYTWIGIIFFLNFLLFIKIINVVTKKQLVVYFLLFIILTPTFSANYYRLLYQEKYVLLSFQVIVLLLLKLDKLSLFEKVVLTISILFALLIKELPFLTFFIMGIVLFNFFKNRRNKKISLFFIFPSIFYIVIYMVWILPLIEHRHALNGMSYIENTLKAFIEWTLGDPILFLIFIPITIIRWVQILLKKEKIIIYDVFLVGGFVYILGFFILKIAYNTHYLLAVYAFAVPTTIFFLIEQKWYRKSFFIGLITLTCILQINNISITINDVIFQRNNNKNFSQIICQIVKIIKHSDDQRKNFYVLGGGDWGNHFSYGLVYFLERNNFDQKKFDILSYETVKDSINLRKETKTPYSFMDVYSDKQIRSGDFLLITPYCESIYHNVDMGKYTMIYKCNNVSSFILPTIKDDIVRKIALKIGFFSENIRNKKSGQMVATYVLYKKR